MNCDFDVLSTCFVYRKIKYMSSIKVKYRRSTSEGREGRIYYQIIHERVVRQWFSDYNIFDDEWDAKKSSLIISPKSSRRGYLLSIKECIKWDVKRFRRIISEFTVRKDAFTTDEIIDEFSLRNVRQSFFRFMESVIVRLRESGKQRTSETYISPVG